MNNNDFYLYTFSWSIQRKLMYKSDRKDITECSLGTFKKF